MKFEDSWENNTHQDVEDAIKDKVEEIEGRIDDVEESVPDTETIEAIRQAAQDAQDAAAAVGDIINENSGRVSHAKAPAVVLRYIHQNGTDDMSLDDLNAGDVYADAGGSLELVVIENGSKTVKNIGTIDKGLIFYSIREDGFFRYLGSAAWELLSQGGEEEQEGTFAELDVDSRLKHIQSPVMVLDCISQSEEPGIADCPIGGYYCYMGNQASACRIRYRKAQATAGHYRDIDLSSPQGHVLYYNKPEDKTYRWDGQRLVAVLWHAGLAIDNRLMSSRATAIVLWYISANLVDGEIHMDPQSGDVYCDSNNHIIVRGGTVNPDKEYVTAASLPTTPDADLGLPDQKLVYYDVNKKGFYRWNGVEWKKALDIDIDTTNLVTITQLNNTLSSYATKNYVDQAVQQSAGQDGKSAYQVAVDNGFRGSEYEWLASLHGADGVASGDDVYVVNNYNGVPADLPQGKVAVLGAGLGTSIGKVFNVNTADANNATPYRLWVGTQAQLEVLEANDGIEDDVIYLIGTVPTPAVRYNVSKNLTNCTVPASTPATAKEGAAFSVTVSPASGYTIDSCYATMGSSTINGVPLTGANAGKYQITINAVTANISISASASVHLQSITVTQGTRAGNTIQMNAALNPANADNVSLQWSVSGGSQYVTINPSTGLLTILEGASNVSVTVTCTDTNSASGAPSGTLQLTGLSYDDSVPLVSLGAVSYTAGAAANTYQFSVAKNPAGANTHSIKWDIDSVSPRGAATINADTGLLTITNDCEVVVSAKAYQGMAQDTNINTATSGSVQLIYALTGPIQFKDLNAKRMMLYDIDNGNWVSSDKTDEDVAADTTLTYENAATKSRRPGISNANYFTSGKSWPVKYFPELKLFTAFNNAADIVQIKSLREATSVKINSNSNSKLADMPYLTRVSFDDSLNSLVFSGNDASQGVQNCATLQVLDFRNTQVVGRTENNGRLFHGCAKLKCVKFPATVTALGTSSNYIVFGKNITSLKYLSFDGNGMTAMNLVLSNNTDVSVIFTYIPGENEELLPNLTLIKLVNNSTSDTSRLKNIYVPDDAINTYKAHSYLSTLESKIKGISELPADWDKTIFDIAMTGVHDTAQSPVTQVEGWTGFSTTIQADEGNSLDNAVVTMCGEDITADVLDKATGALNIPSVEGDVIINIVTPTE